MKIEPEELIRRLESALGAGAVASDLVAREAHAVDGLVPHLVCHPANADQVATVLRICGEVAAAVAPWGGGTAMGLGNLPIAVDVVLVLDRLSTLIEHDASNLTATAQAGMTLAALQDHLRQRRQFLPLDPPRPARATVGGTIAANLNGPRRMVYGGVRDVVIGMKMVLATGEQVKAGGKVVKNVAGYDMCKLVVGALGTLGVITEATFKMSPAPERIATIVARGTTEQALHLADLLFASTLQPSAITLLSAGASAAAGLGRSGALAVGVDGFAEAVERHLRDVTAMAASAGLLFEVLHDSGHEALWAAVRDFPSPGDGEAVFRLTVPLASIGDAVAEVSQAGTGAAFPYVVHAGAGTLWVRVDPARAGAVFPGLIAAARRVEGHAVMIAAPADIKRGVDVWGPPSGALPIMREIKRQFDPHRVLNPGRFVAFL